MSEDLRENQNNDLKEKNGELTEEVAGEVLKEATGDTHEAVRDSGTLKGVLIIAILIIVVSTAAFFAVKYISESRELKEDEGYMSEMLADVKEPLNEWATEHGYTLRPADATEIEPYSDYEYGEELMAYVLQSADDKSEVGTPVYLLRFFAEDAIVEIALGPVEGESNDACFSLLEEKCDEYADLIVMLTQDMTTSEDILSYIQDKYEDIRFEVKGPAFSYQMLDVPLAYEASCDEVGDDIVYYQTLTYVSTF